MTISKKTSAAPNLYLRHYFFLENTVQHWYHIAEELHDRAEEAR